MKTEYKTLLSEVNKNLICQYLKTLVDMSHWVFNLISRGKRSYMTHIKRNEDNKALLMKHCGMSLVPGVLYYPRDEVAQAMINTYIGYS